MPVGGRLRVFGAIPMDLEAKVGKGKEATPKLAGLSPAELIASGATNYRRWVNFPWAVVERGGQTEAGAWTPADAARLAALSALAHSRGLWIRFYTLNGHAAADNRGWTASYNFGSPAAVETRWRAARDAGVDFIATDRVRGVGAGPRPSRRRMGHRAPGRAGSCRRAASGRAGTRRHAAPQRLAHQPGGQTPAGGRFPAGDDRDARSPLSGHHQQRLFDADADRGGHRAVGIKARVPVEHAWLGLAWNAGGTRLYSAGAAENTVHVFDYAAGALKQGTPLVVAPSALKLPPGTTDMAGTGFVGGIATAVDGKTLFAVHVFGRAISAIDLATGAVRTTVSLPAEPYTAVPASDGRRVFVSLWGGAKVLALDPATLAPMGEVSGRRASQRDGAVEGRPAPVRRLRQHEQGVGDRHGDADRARADRRVAVSRSAAGHDAERPVACRPTAATLAVANADNNTVAMVDIAQPGRERGRAASSRPAGTRPSVLFDRTGRRLFVLSGKGLIGQANPRGPQPCSPMNNGQYTGELLQGTLSVVDVPDAAHLAADTARRHRAVAPTPMRRRLTPAGAPAASPDPAPRRRCLAHQARLLRHPREPHLRPDPRRPRAGQRRSDARASSARRSTPNAHALAREFVLLDNFYVDAEVSYDGHAFSTGAYATDVVEKMWPTNYGRRGGVVSQRRRRRRSQPVRQPLGPAATATSGTSRTRAA